MAAGNLYNIGLFSNIGSVNIPSFIDYVVTEGYSVAGLGAATYAVTATTGATAYRKQSSDGRWWQIDVNQLYPAMVGALGDGVTDDAAAYQAALNYGAGSPGSVFGGRLIGSIASPLIIPNGVRLEGLGGQQSASGLKLLSTFPHTTINGDQTLPYAAFSSTFTLNVASTAGFPLGSGGITPAGGVGVLVCKERTILYTGTTSTSFTGCWTVPCDIGVTLANGSAISTPAVWLTGPGDGQVGFSTRIDGFSIDCNDVAGSACLWTSHLQEGGGWSDMLFKAFRNYGFRADQAYAFGPTAAQCNDWDGKDYWCTTSDNAESECVDIHIALIWPPGGVKTPQQDYGLRNGSHVVMHNGGPNGTAIRIDGCVGNYGPFHMESKNRGIVIGEYSRCSVVLSGYTISNSWSNSGGAGVDLGAAYGNSAFVMNGIKADAIDVANRVILNDQNVGAVAASQKLTSSANYADGDTISIGRLGTTAKVYTLQTTLTNVDGNIHIAATEAQTLTNIANAINASGGTAGTDYATAMTPHPNVFGTSDGQHIVTATALIKGTAANAVTTTETSGTASWGEATLAGGVAGSLSQTLEQIQEYRLFADGSSQINGGARYGLYANRPSANSSGMSGALWGSTDLGRFNLAMNNRWYGINLDPGITLVSDSLVTGALDGGSSSTQVFTFAKTTTIGNHVIIAITAAPDKVVTGIVDSAGNVYQVDVTKSGQGPAVSICSSHITVGNSISDTLTATLSGTCNYICGQATQWSGLKASGWADVTNTNNGSTGSGAINPTTVNTVPDVLWYGAVAFTDSSYRTAGTGFTALTGALSGAGNRRVSPIYKISSDFDTGGITWGGGSNGWDAGVVKYKAASAS
jgi:hypothetical protein